MKALAIYVRTSTEKQETGLEAQLMACKDYCAREGITNFQIFADDDESGSKESRPEFDRMLAAIDRGEIDTVLVYCLSRLSRLTLQSLMLAAQLHARGVGLKSCSEPVDLETPEGRLMFAILAAFAQFQREDIVRKVNNGLVNARRKGRVGGRPRTKGGKKDGAPRPDDRIRELHGQGVSPSAIAEQLDVSRGAVYRVIKASDRNAA